MTSIRAIVVVLGLLLVGLTASGQDLPGRTELKRADLAVSNDMEVINSLLVLRPGDQVPLHSHHGVEAAYVVEGGTIQRNGKPPEPLPTGASILNARDVVHGGFRVVGDKTIKLATVHIVDKGKPLFEYVK